jgi:dUTP pyrophosphatase
MIPPWLRVYIKRMSATARTPTRAHTTDAGWDLYLSRDLIIAPGEAGDAHTDICLGLPAGWYANIKPRSSTWVRYGIHVVEGVVDSGYRGELFIQAVNQTDETVQIELGTRIAQILFLPVPEIDWVNVHQLPESERGEKGFGLSGK